MMHRILSYLILWIVGVILHRNLSHVNAQSCSVGSSVSAGCNTLRTCQGGSYNAALNNCPDRGYQKLSNGGNVTIFVKYATRLPNRDHTGPSAKLSDPYVKFTAGTSVGKTSVIRNNLNPDWGREGVNLGVLGSATEILVEIWDSDSGLEFSDDLLARGKIRVPFCSTFMANDTYLPCGQPFGCASYDSMWHMPTRQTCLESGSLSFISAHTKCDSPLSVCLFFEVQIVPFTMTVDLTYKDATIQKPVLSAACGPQLTANDVRFYAPWTKTFGAPFLDVFSAGFTVDMNALTYKSIAGALMLKQVTREKSYGAPGSVKFYASVNFPANIYVCRFATDNDIGLPTWLTTEYSSMNTSVNQFQLSSIPTPFACYYKFSPGTKKNRYGGVIRDAIPFRSNTLPQYPYTGTAADDSSGLYTYPYIVLAVPHVVAAREDIVIVYYDSALFIDSLFSYGLVWAWFMYLIANFLHRIDFKLERIDTYIVSRVLTGTDKSILATLFSDYGNTPCNVEFRAHLYHAKNIFRFILLMPFLLLISWGFCVEATVRPTGLGFIIVFIGSGAVLFWFGFESWQRSGWRLTGSSFLCQSLSVVFFLCYIISVIFVDTAVTQYNQPLNFSALSLVFGTINLFPLMLLVFEKDQSHTKNLRLFMEKLHKAVKMLKSATKQANEETSVVSADSAVPSSSTLNKAPKKQKPLSTNKLLHALLGSTYTINPFMPLFKFAAVVQEAPHEEETVLSLNSNLSDLANVGKGHELYNTSLVILFIYLMIGVSRTGYPSLAFLNCLTLMLFDFLHYNLNNGPVKWSPGKKISVLVAGRLLIMGSGSSLWMVNYSVAYCVYATVLIRDCITASLPMLTKGEAGRVVFAGIEEIGVVNNDIAASSEYALCVLTFAFLAILVVSGLGNDNGALPVAPITIWRARWYPYTFGLISICCTITGGLGMAMVRAFYLQKHGLLRGWARTKYMIKKEYNVPIILAVLTEIAILTSGILIYGATKSSFILICCVFLPAIGVCFGHAYTTWVKNDFELIIWPPRDETEGDKSGGPSDLDVAFNMIENIFGNDVNIIPDDDEPPETEPVKTMKGFKLPSLDATGTRSNDMIKMPPLPLKSVLRRKRQAMGIKVKTPLVKDLKARDDVVDIDRFGNEEEDVIDAADPWAQFEEKEVKKKKAATAMTKVARMRGSWFENEYYVAAKKKFLSYKSGQWIAKKWEELWAWVRTSTHKYAKIYAARFKKAGEDDDDDDDIDDQSKKIDDNDLSIPMSERLAKMPFWSAAAAGYLTRQEYITLASFFGGNLLILIMGVIIGSSSSPNWYGEVLWVSIVMAIFTLVPVYKYFNTFVMDDTMKQMLYFVVLFHIIFCASFFGAALDGDIGLASSLWLLDYFFYFPAFLYIVVEGMRWVDDGFIVEALDKDGDNDVTIAEYIEFFRAYPILLGMMIILVWQLFLWINALVGQVCVILLLVSGLGYIFARDWAVNDHYLSPELATIGELMINFTMFISFCVAIFSSKNPIFALSVFFFCLIVRYALRVLSAILALDADTMFYFSPYIFPIYSFDSKSNDVVDQSQLGKFVLYALIAGALWGASMATFLYPVNVGIAVACAFLLIIMAVIATAMSFLPTELGKYAAMLVEDSIIQAASTAINNFHDRKLPANFEIPNYEGDAPVEVREVPKSVVDRQKERTSLEIAMDIVSETRALTHIKDDSDYVATQQLTLEEEDQEDHPWYIRYWKLFVAQIKKLIEMIPRNKEYKRHSFALFSYSDMLAEALIVGKGPFGFLGCEGLWYRLFKKAQLYPRLDFLNTKWLNVYDEFGNSSNVAKLSEPMDLRGVLSRFPEFDQGLNYTYFEEARCAIHFLLLIMSVADSTLQREQVLFQKFLRENRFRLASNGISPPAAIFSSSSFSSIDIPLVAVWLSTLTDEERERFHALKATFSEEQKVRDEAIDSDDYQFAYDAMILKNEREMREQDLNQRLREEVQRMQMQRVHAFAETLSGYEAKIFELKSDVWTKDADCFVEDKNRDLYEKFRAACMSDNDEVTEYARQHMGEIESAQTDCRVGEYGRVYQYVDSEFLPGDVSIGDVALSDQILGWRCAPGISDAIQLFEGGTDPDDVEIGIFQDNWLLSALSMLAAGDGVGDGKVDDQIKQLFVGHYDMNGEITFHTELGGYCIRLYKQGIWHPVWVDDLFPMVKRAKWTNENRGIAAAHSKECRELWVSLIEKAYAKYLGSYAELNRGYVHHALQELTGCEAECVPIAFASRGTGKRPLWDMLIRYRRNGYIVGAGTGASKLADKDVQDMGIAFNAAYTIYDVRQVDGVKVIKLRNPPGHREEWKGDWSDKSKLWNRRFKHKLNWVDADDHTFYMSFDDFCNVFRYLFICKWYDPGTWTTQQCSGFWKLPHEAEEEEEIDMQALMMIEAGEEGQMVEKKPKKEKKKDKEKALIDTAGGLPTNHNPGCVLENNPHYTLQLHRTTELRVEVIQADSRGRSSAELLPVSIFIVKNAHHKVPMRLQELTKHNIVARTKEPKAERSVYLYANLKPGMYIVLIPLYLKGMEGNFTVKIMSNYTVKFTPLWPPKWMVTVGGKSRQELAIDAGAATAKKKLDMMSTWAMRTANVLLGAGEDDDEEEEKKEITDEEKQEIDDVMDRVEGSV